MDRPYVCKGCHKRYKFHGWLLRHKKECADHKKYVIEKNYKEILETLKKTEQIKQQIARDFGQEMLDHVLEKTAWLNKL